MTGIQSEIKRGAKAIYDRRKIIVVAWLLSVAFYSFMTVLRITNTKDGLWSGEYYNTGDSGIAEGRWLWPLIEKLRFSNSIEPITSCICLLFIIIGLIMITDILEARHKMVEYVFMATVLVSPVVCTYLSYRFNATVFGLSFLLAVLTVFVLVKYNYSLFSIMASVVIMVLDLAVYQAQMAIIMLLMVVILIKELCVGSKLKTVLRKFAIDATVVIVSFILYKMLWNISCSLNNIQVTAYRGADNMTIADMIINLPGRIADSYKAFITYYYDHDALIRHNMLQDSPLMILISLAVLAVIIFTAVDQFKASVSRGFAYLFFWLIIPLTLTVYFLVASNALVELQLSMTQTLLFPLILILADSVKLQDCFKQRTEWIVGVLAVLIFVLGYGAAYMTSVDIYSAYEGRKTSDALMTDVRTELLEQGLYGRNYKYIFLGAPCGNHEFVVHHKWLDANRIMRFGYFFPGGDNMKLSYNGLFEYEGTFIRFSDADKYDELVENGIADSMPLFPDEGSIRQIDGYVVVKISNIY